MAVCRRISVYLRVDQAFVQVSSDLYVVAEAILLVVENVWKLCRDRQLIAIYGKDASEAMIN